MILNLNHTPLLRLIIPYILGVVSSIYLQPNSLILNTFFLFGLILLITIQVVKKLNSNYKFRWYIGILIYSNLFLAGATITNLKYQNTIKNTKLITNDYSSLILGKVSENPQEKKQSLKTIIKIQGLKSNDLWKKGKGNVLLYLKKDSLSSTLKIGDLIAFEPKLKDIPSPNNPHEFNYKTYLANQSIHLQAFFKSDNWAIINQEESFNLFKFSSKCRESLILLLNQRGLKDKELAVAAAIILGDKDTIDQDLKSAYSTAGAMHILAVSGLHVGVIFLIFSSALSFLEKIKNGHILNGVILILILWSYAILTGLSPSVMRAATMFSFIIGARMSKRNSNFFNTLAASAFVLLIGNPYLILDVGFQLSYLAVTGIVIIQPWLSQWFSSRYWLINQFWEITTVSLAAQIATLPISLLYFHQFPNYFLLTNLVVIPLAFIILYLGIITLVLSFIPIINNILAICLKYTIQLLNFAVNQIEGLPYSLSENIRFTVYNTFLAYIFLLSLVLFISYRKFNTLLIGCLSIIIFLSTTFYSQCTNLKQRKIFLYSINNTTAINFIDGNDNILIADKNLIKEQEKLKFHVQNNWTYIGADNKKTVLIEHLNKKYSTYCKYKINNKNLFVKNNYFQFYDKKIVVLDNKHTAHLPSKPLALDLLILTKNIKTPLSKILGQFNPSQVLIDSSNSTFTRKRLIKEASKIGISYWDVASQGAFEMSF